MFHCFDGTVWLIKICLIFALAFVPHVTLYHEGFRCQSLQYYLILSFVLLSCEGQGGPLGGWGIALSQAGSDYRWSPEPPACEALWGVLALSYIPGPQNVTSFFRNSSASFRPHSPSDGPRFRRTLGRHQCPCRCAQATISGGEIPRSGIIGWKEIHFLN